MARAKREPIEKNSRSYLDMQIRNARAVIMTILLCTLVNLVLLLVDANTYFLFSASVPYYFTALAMIWDGWGVGSYTVIALVVSAVILGAYVACWVVAKKKDSAFLVALVMFAVDTAALVVITFTIVENPISNILDFVFHAMAIWELAVGISSAKKRKNLPPEDAPSGMDGILLS